MNINKVTLAGNLCSEPELRFLPSGKAITKLSVAVNRKWRDESGEEKKEATFVDVTAFGKTAETVAQYFRKGRKIYLDGRLRLETWEDKTTKQKRSKLGVIMESFQFVDSKQDLDEPKPAPPPKSSVDKSPTESEDDQVPF